MDLSMLLSQAQMSYSKMNFYKNPKNGKKNNNQELLVQVFQQNLDLISSYLSQKDTIQLRLLCRGVGYLFIVRDLWSGMKVQVADKKLEDIEDYQFVEEQPKQISKEDKKIRIHSLRKNMANSINKKAPRQASNIKEKKLSMAVIDNQLNPFQKTEIGFKRLLKTNNPSLIKTSSKIKQQKNIDIEENMSIQRLPELLQIPKQYSIDDLIINSRDQWVKNMHRANNLITVVRRWNSFHQKFWVFVGKEESELILLMKKMIKLDGCLLSYKTSLQEQPLSTILSIISESAPKNALIEDQLNKLGKQFVSNHKDISTLIENKQTQLLITALHQCYQKVSQKINKPQLQPTVWIEGLTIIEEGYDNVLSKLSHKKFKSSLLKSITNTFKQLLTQHLNKDILFPQKISMRQITLKFIIENSQFSQLAFQIIYSLIGKVAINSQSSTQKPQASSSSIKLNQSSLNFSKKLKPMQKSNESRMSSTLSKFTQSKENMNSNKLQKTLFGILWNISKYFDKLQKQLALKQKKKKQEQKVNLIKSFIENQCNIFNQTIELLCNEENEDLYMKSLSSLEDYYKEFKVKIQKLKDQMAKTNN